MTAVSDPLSNQLRAVITTAPFTEIIDGVSIEVGEKPIEDTIFVHKDPKINFFAIQSSKTLDQQIEYEEQAESETKSSDLIYPDEFDDEEIYSPLDNEFEIPVQLVSDLNSNVDSVTEKLRELLLLRSASQHMAYDTATSQVEAILRDEFDAEVTIDSQPLHYLNFVTDLELLVQFLSTSSVDEKLREKVVASFIDNTMPKVTERVSIERKSGAKSNKFRAVLESLHARKESGSLLGAVALNTKGNGK